MRTLLLPGGEGHSLPAQPSLLDQLLLAAASTVANAAAPDAAAFGFSDDSSCEHASDDCTFELSCLEAPEFARNAWPAAANEAQQRAPLARRSGLARCAHPDSPIWNGLPFGPSAAAAAAETAEKPSTADAAPCGIGSSPSVLGLLSCGADAPLLPLPLEIARELALSPSPAAPAAAVLPQCAAGAADDAPLSQRPHSPPGTAEAQGAEAVAAAAAPAGDSSDKDARRSSSSSPPAAAVANASPHERAAALLRAISVSGEPPAAPAQEAEEEEGARSLADNGGAGLPMSAAEDLISCLLPQTDAHSSEIEDEEQRRRKRQALRRAAEEAASAGEAAAAAASAAGQEEEPQHSQQQRKRKAPGADAAPAAAASACGEETDLLDMFLDDNMDEMEVCEPAPAPLVFAGGVGLGRGRILQTAAAAPPAAAAAAAAEEDGGAVLSTPPPPPSLFDEILDAACAVGGGDGLAGKPSSLPLHLRRRAPSPPPAPGPPPERSGGQPQASLLARVVTPGLVSRAALAGPPRAALDALTHEV